MKTRIEFGKIKSVVQGDGFYRTITVLESDKVSDGQIVINSTLFAETKEDLEVIDHENFPEVEKTVELLQCNECGTREWIVLNADSDISHEGDGCSCCAEGVYLFSRKCKL